MAMVADQVTVKQHGFHIQPRKLLAPTDSDSSTASTVSGPGIPAVGPRRDTSLSETFTAPPKVARHPAGKAVLSLPTVAPQPVLELVGKATPDGRRLVKEVMQGLRAQQVPTASTEGLGGTYFFKDSWGTNVAIIKPCDEEPLAPNNPKGFVGRALGDPGMKPTVRVGEAALREVAAYLLDHDHFAGVPHTVLVNIAHPIFHVNAPLPPTRAPALPSSLRAASSWMDPASLSLGGFGTSPGDQDAVQLLPKLASLQGFVPHTGDSSDMGTSQFSVGHVHRIGVLDLRLYNTDRHAGNLLVQPAAALTDSARARPRLQGSLGLAPIDHGFCLPEALEPPYFEWLHWPQAMLPFSQEVLDYIERLDPEADCELLRSELPWLKEAALHTLYISTMLLKAGAAAGLTLHEIGTIFSRSLVGVDEEPSQLERLCSEAMFSMQQQLADNMSEASSEVLISDGVPEGWEEDALEGEAADSLDFSTSDLQFSMESEDDHSASGDLPARLLGMPLPMGRQNSLIPSRMSISPASLSPCSPSHISHRTSEASAMTVHRRSSSPDSRATSDAGHVLASPSSRRHVRPLSVQASQPHHIVRRKTTEGEREQEAGLMMAKSVAAGHMMRHVGGRLRNRRRRHEAAGHHKARFPDINKEARAASPAIDGAPADPLAGLEAEDWPLFVQCLKGFIHQGLAENKLGLGDTAPGCGRGIIGTSCPAF